MFFGKQKDVYDVPEEAQTVRETTTQATPKRGKSLKNRCRLSTYRYDVMITFQHTRRVVFIHITGQYQHKQDINSIYPPLAFLKRNNLLPTTQEEVCMLVRSLFNSTIHTVRRELFQDSRNEKKQQRK